MTKRHSGMIVVLGEDTPEGETEEIMRAIRMIKGVVAVQPVISDPAMEIVENRRDIAWRSALRRISNGGPPRV